ncbi:MAG: MopE-related protein [Myxococcota bacterium]|nr:MopE-related protein [Myxococcota bacterium]
MRALPVARRAMFIIAFLAMSAVGLSCDVNDYCLNCATNGDGGNGDGGDGDGNDGDNGDGPDASPCVNTGPEVCDNKDNDCDGAVDEGQLPTIGDLCDNQMGLCAGGVKTCVTGTVRCTKPPVAETCDGLDNDCDGTPDDGDPGGGAKCGTDMGECKAGVFTCQSGAIQCVGAIGGTMAPYGAPESCDGKDNNCDGMIDNGAPVSATFCDNNDDDGMCNKGVPTCIGGATICVGLVGPSVELCDNMDQDCDGSNTNGFFLQTDPTNCGSCGMVCTLMNAVEGCAGGACTIAACEANYHNNNNQTADGCEFGPCTKNGNEVCNNADDDCDGLTDMADSDMVTPPVATMCRVAGECAGATVLCDGAAGGFRCDYPDPDVEETNGVIQAETLCDGKDNDCDGAIDEGQPNLNQSCTNGQGECQTTGIFVCPTSMTGPAVCNAAPPGAGATETCDGKDNDCNGTIDDNAALGMLPGQEWVPLPIAGSTVEMMKYEASRPDATTTAIGSLATHACSRPNTQPWTSITYPQAVAVCNGMGARLCTETEWQSTCLPDVVYPVPAATLTTNVTDFVFIEAENPQTNATIGGRTWARTSPASFNGITAMQVADAGFSQTTAANALTQSARLSYQVTLAGATTYRVWIRMRSPAAASRSVWVGLTAGASAGAANGTLVTTTADNQWQWVLSPALTSGTAGTHTFSIYLREDGVMIDTIAFSRQATNTPTFDNAWAYETNPRTAQPQVCNGDEVDTAPAVAIAASPTGATASGTTATFNTTTPHRLSVGSSVTVAGVGVGAYNGTWTVVTTPTTSRFTATIGTSNPAASGGGTANGDQDDILATGWSAACHAEHPTGDAFDLSGNVKEWTNARAFGQNPLRGGSSNNAVNGLTCKLNFTLADNNFFFPNVGFRCCRD